MIAAGFTHVAILVPSLDQAVQFATGLGLKINPFKEFEDDGAYTSTRYYQHIYYHLWHWRNSLVHQRSGYLAKTAFV